MWCVQHVDHSLFRTYPPHPGTWCWRFQIRKCENLGSCSKSFGWYTVIFWALNCDRSKGETGYQYAWCFPEIFTVAGVLHFAVLGTEIGNTVADADILVDSFCCIHRVMLTEIFDELRIDIIIDLNIWCKNSFGCFIIESIVDAVEFILFTIFLTISIAFIVGLCCRRHVPLRIQAECCWSPM